VSTSTLTGLRDFLYGTLTPSNLVWLGTQLTEYGKNKGTASLRSSSKEELIARAEEGRKHIAEGHYVSIEDVLEKLDKMPTEVSTPQREVV